MNRVHVDAASGSYDVIIGQDLLGGAGEVVRASAGGTTAFLVSDSNVMPLYGAKVRDSLQAAGYRVVEKCVPAGEQTKNLTSLADLLESMAQAGCTRDDVVVALGGGVVGDLAGFAAATYMRGCAVVQVATSLLAMVDSSVGGKTAVDLSCGKNLAGAFWQPKAVIADVTCLTTISSDLLRDSMGEVIKYAVMCDPRLFEGLEAAPLSSDRLDPNRLEEVVTRCVQIKRDVVQADERESGLRETLNLGHTIGHAIEAESNYEQGHGSCVAAGLCCMARADRELGLLTPGECARIEALVAAHGLPTDTPVSHEALYQRSLSDKKRHADSLRLVEIHGIGSVVVNQVPLEDYKKLIELGCGSAPAALS